MRTRLMSKLFSDTTSEEYKEKIQEKIDEAHENGSATLEEDNEILQFADVDGDIIVEDQTDGMNEVTRISQNPEDENDLVMSAVEVPADDATDETETPEVEITNEGDVADDAEDVQVDIENEEGEQTYSLKFKKFSSNKAKLIARVFSDVVECIDQMPTDAVDEDVQVKVTDGKVKTMSVSFGKPTRTFSEGEETPEETEEEKVDETADVTEVIDDANDLAEKVEGGITKENAEEIKDAAEKIIEKAESCEAKGFSLKSIKAMAKKFSEEAAEVADAEEEVADETAEEEEGATEEVVTESNANPQVMQCPETGKWFIEGDPDKKLYDTQEEANEVAAREFCDNKTFSDPKVTVTIEDLEPASISSLLGGPDKEEEKDDDLEPKASPNEEYGRSFSMTPKEESINPLLTTEIV